MKWTDKVERGSVCLIGLIAWLARTAGRPFCRLLLYPIVLYFLITDQTARRASFEFISAVKGRPARVGEIFDHIYSFAVTLLDRVYMANNDFERFEVTIENQHLVEETLKKDKGCVLLGSHLGSFDFMSLATRSLGSCPLNILMRVSPNARLRSIAGIDDSMLKVIPLGKPNSLILAFEMLSKGEAVATLADRVEGHSSLATSFLGRSVKMPISPYVLAARSGAPLLACFGLYEGGNRYRIKFIETGLRLESSASGIDFQSAVDRYAQILEEQARLYPMNWFNFYPYWNDKVGD